MRPNGSNSSQASCNWEAVEIIFRASLKRTWAAIGWSIKKAREAASWNAKRASRFAEKEKWKSGCLMQLLAYGTYVCFRLKKQLIFIVNLCVLHCWLVSGIKMNIYIKWQSLLNSVVISHRSKTAKITMGRGYCVILGHMESAELKISCTTIRLIKISVCKESNYRWSSVLQAITIL